jgi:transposase InsO family protein
VVGTAGQIQRSLLIAELTAPMAERLHRSFNGRLCDEWLNLHLFWSLAHTRVVIRGWKTEYNHHRRHSALGYQAPARCAEACTHQ